MSGRFIKSQERLGTEGKRNNFRRLHIAEK